MNVDTLTDSDSPHSIRARNNVRESGTPTGRPLVFAHGFGCSQESWRRVIPHFDAYRVITFDNVGAGDSDPAAYDRAKYDSLDGYASDVVDILDALDLRDAVFIGHSVSGMVGVLASLSTDRLGALVLVGPSPRYVNDGDYVGGFEQEDIDGLIDALDINYLGWSSTMAPVMMGNADRPHLGEELAASFCRVDPAVARQFARVTFLSDHRHVLGRVTLPTLVLQAEEDVIAPLEVGRYVHDHIAGSEFRMLTARGHIPNLSQPDDLAGEIKAFLA